MKRSVLSILAATSLTSAAARADIHGFGDFTSGFKINVYDSGASPSLDIANDTIQFTNQGSLERRTIFANAPQSIGQFSASFTYWSQNDQFSVFGQGATFVIQNDARGLMAAGDYGAGLGYGNSFGIQNSVAITLELTDNVISHSGMYTNGTLGGGSPATSPINLSSGDHMSVTLTYDGAVLHETITDLTNPLLTPFSRAYLINIPAIVGGPTAIVGLTASTDFGADQYFQGLQFVTPEPSSALLFLLATAVGFCRRRA